MVRPKERAAYGAMLVETARRADTTYAGSPCPDAQVRDVATQSMPVSGHPGGHLLHEKLEVSGCGRSATQNIYVVRASGSPPWRMVATMPGDSLADMTLQTSVWAAALKQARVDLPSDCKGQRLQDVYVAARPGHVVLRTPDQPPSPKRAGWFSVTLPQALASQQSSLDPTQAWLEIWPLTLCGQDRTLAVVFIPLKDHAHSAYAFLPIWRIVQASGPRALPAPAPEVDSADSATAGQSASPNPAS